MKKEKNMNNEMEHLERLRRVDRAERKAGHNGFLAEALLEVRDLVESGSEAMGIIDEALGKAGLSPRKPRHLVPAFDGAKTRTECVDHLDYTETLDGGVCNDCGAELVILPSEEDTDEERAQVPTRHPECKGRGTVHTIDEECDHCRNCGGRETDPDGLCEICLKCSLCCEDGTFDDDVISVSQQRIQAWIDKGEV